MSLYNSLIERPKGFVGTCVNCFDEDGRCIVPDLPWDDVSRFAVADERAAEITREAFLAKAHVPEDLAFLLEGRYVAYIDMEGVLAIHELDEDVHYLFA
jgi:hypothetical protein